MGSPIKDKKPIILPLFFFSLVTIVKTKIKKPLSPSLSLEFIPGRTKHYLPQPTFIWSASYTQNKKTSLESCRFLSLLSTFFAHLHFLYVYMTLSVAMATYTCFHSRVYLIFNPISIINRQNSL